MKTTGPFVTDKSLQKGATYSLETTFTVEGEPPYSLELELKAGMCTYIDECVPPGQAVTEEKGGETLYDGVIDGD